MDADITFYELIQVERQIINVRKRINYLKVKRIDSQTNPDRSIDTQYKYLNELNETREKLLTKLSTL